MSIDPSIFFKVAIFTILVTPLILFIISAEGDNGQPTLPDAATLRKQLMARERVDMADWERRFAEATGRPQPLILSSGEIVLFNDRHWWAEKERRFWAGEEERSHAH